jgi:prepilin peptidase CpaA
MIAWAATAALYDWRWRRLPNWLTLGGLVLGVAWASLAGDAVPAGELARNGVAAGMALLTLLFPYLAGWLGAGDVKLYAAMGFLGGSAVLGPTLLTACIVAGIGALVILLREGHRRGRRLPFGVGLALGFILSVGGA